MRHSQLIRASAAAALLAFAGSAGPVQAADLPLTMRAVEAGFDTVFQDLTDAIVNRGLVIDYTGHSGTMLERTADVAGQGASPFANARYMQFCSSVLTHESVAADASNISMCPYLVFAYETRANPGKVVVGYRKPDMRDDAASTAGAAKIEALLTEIIGEAGQ